MTYALITCRKYTLQSLRVADVGDQDPTDVIDKIPPRECPICGPFSHTELGWRGYLEVLGQYPYEQVALAARRRFIAEKPTRYTDL